MATASGPEPTDWLFEVHEALGLYPDLARPSDRVPDVPDPTDASALLSLRSLADYRALVGD
jgi:hypothetical protein